MNTLQPVALDHSHRLCLEYARLTTLTSGGPIDLYLDSEGRASSYFEGLVVRGVPYSGRTGYTPQGALCLLDLRRTDLGFSGTVTNAARAKALEIVNHAIVCARFHGHLDALSKATEDRRIRCERRELTDERATLVARLAEIDRGLAALPTT
jgi:hypothetical protein